MIDPCTLIKRQVFDNFLHKETFDSISQVAMGNCHDMPLLYKLQEAVAKNDDIEKEMPPWNWMAISKIYDHNQILQPPFYADIADNVLPLIEERVYNFRSIIRIKANFYPWTNKLHHHRYHNDYDWPNIGAVLSMNTCDGYTEFEDGQIVESVANRLVVFNAQNLHRSTTTTTTWGRFNINFNFL
tara:strand:- start:255 stop:809 length:555 start_codon:yes stop_codon:yes gene_type:complete